MRHARDGAVAAMSAAARILVARGKSEPAEVENPDVRWSLRASDGVWAPTRDGQHIHIGIVCTAGDRQATILRPSLRVFVGADIETDIVAQTTATGMRLVTVMHGPDAPTEYRFPVTLADGLALDPMPSGGFDVVHVRYGATVGRFFAPWGCDSAFRPVTANYRLDGTTIVMNVRHTGAIYPVVADPLYGR